MAATPLFVIIALVLSLQTPAGWEAVYRRVQQLILDHKTADAIVVLDSMLKSSPGFDPARYELADAHRMLALEAALKGPSQEAAKRRQLELAAAAYRRVAEGTSEYKPLAIGRLLMVYGEDELNRPAEVIPVARQYVADQPWFGHRPRRAGERADRDWTGTRRYCSTSCRADGRSHRRRAVAGDGDRRLRPQSDDVFDG